MLTYEAIKEISAEKGVADFIVEKDYVLDWVLWGIAQHQGLGGNLVFKGGTALHKIYFPDWRFSEDLDFTTISQMKEKVLKEALEILCEKVADRSGLRLSLKSLERKGDEQADWLFEAKIGYIGPRQQRGGDLPTIKLDITHDEKLIDQPKRKQLLNTYPDLPRDAMILCYSLEEILAEKIRTVLHQRCWSKDIYDLWRLLKEGARFIDIEKVMDIYIKKSKYKKLNPVIPNDINESILRLKDQWSQSIKRQTGNPPDFDQVYPAIITLIENLFRTYETIKGGKKMLETNYVMRYKKGDLEIEVQGDKEFVQEKFIELLELEIKKTAQITTVENHLSSPIPEQRGEHKRQSLSEFLKAKNPKTHGDKMLVFGYYLEKFENQNSFNLDDIERCYSAAKMPRTKNFGTYLAGLIRNGYLMEATEKKDNKKAWTLTQSGLDYVEKMTPTQV
jgi:predicted nucleotidyltransferase component of viral defense system